MKKSIFFALPLVSVMLLTGCKKKGKPVGIEEALPKAILALDSMVTQDALGATLTGSMDVRVYEKIMNYDNNGNFSSFGSITSDSKVSKLKVTAAVKGLNQEFNKVTASASASGLIDIKTTSGNIDLTRTSVRLVNVNSNIKGNGYLKEGVAYFDHNQGFADFVNEMIYASSGKYGADSADYKYYLPVPLNGNDSLTHDYIIPWYENMKQQMVSSLHNIPTQILSYLSASKYSDTKYGLTFEGNILPIMSSMGVSVIYGEDDTASGKVGVIFDTRTGIQEITVKYNVDFDMTVAEQYAYSPYLLEQIKPYLNDNAVESKGTVDLKLTFAYGSKVKVSTLKNPEDYTIIIPTGGSGGESTTEPDPEPEPDYLDKVSYDTFYAYAEQAYNNSARVNYSYINMDMSWNFPDDNDSFVYACPFPFNADLARDSIGGRNMTDLMISLYTGDQIITPELVFYLNQTFENDDSSAGIYYYVGSNNRLRLEVEYFEYDCSFSLEWNKYGYFTYADYHFSNGDIYESYELYINYYA